MADTIRITASLRIHCALAEVREQYRDIDHHIRNNVHPSIHYQWEPSNPAERKIRTTFRILGIPQFDVSLLEDTEDGSFVIRYLEGTNAGMVLAHRFVQISPGVTEVRLEADAPATLGRRILGPLFVVGARQVMKKALAEDKRDLEKGRYVPGVAAGEVEKALGSLSQLSAKSAEALQAIVESACLISACDGEADLAEKDALRRLSKVLGLASNGLESLLTEFTTLAASEKLKSQAQRLGTILKSADIAKEGLVAMTVVALVSHGMSLGELELLRTLASAAGFPEAELGTLVENADEALMGLSGS